MASPALLMGAQAEGAYLMLAGRRVFTPEERARLDEIRNSSFFLVANGRGTTTSVDDRARCSNCGSKKHPYLTRLCIPQPYRGLRGALWAYVKNRRDDGKASVLGSLLPDLKDAHPFTAHSLQPNVYGEDVLALELGTAIPIKEEEAKRFARMIREKGGQPPWVLR